MQIHQSSEKEQEGTQSFPHLDWRCQAALADLLRTQTYTEALKEGVCESPVISELLLKGR